MLKSIITPKIGLVLIRKELEKQLQKKIDSFEILYRSDNEQVFFIIDAKAFPFEQPMLKKLIIQQTNGSLKDGEKLDVVKIVCDENDEINCAVYYSDKNNEKKFLKTKL